MITTNHSNLLYNGPYEINSTSPKGFTVTVRNNRLISDNMTDITDRTPGNNISE
jgi:hypothetical protein